MESARNLAPQLQDLKNMILAFVKGTQDTFMDIFSNKFKEGGDTVAHKTIPMFCCLGQMDLMWSDDISNGSKTFIKQTTHFWLYRASGVM